MEQYISKSAIIAEIENIESSAICEYKSQPSRYSEGCLDGIHRIKSFINSLESFNTLKIEEVDLEKEIDNELNRTWYGEYLNTDKFKESAVYFFELGLKAQKRE